MTYVIACATHYMRCVPLNSFQYMETFEPLRKDYFGKYPCYDAWTYNSLEKARMALAWIKHHTSRSDWTIHEYDPCACNLGKVVE